MNKSNAGRVFAVSLGGCILSAALAVFTTVTEPPHPSTPYLAWAMCACYGGLLALAAAASGWLGRGQWKRREQAQVQAMAEPKTADAPAYKDAAAWDSLPLLAVPAAGSSVREAVAAFAQRCGMRAYEADRGFVLADAQGQFYRVATS